MDSCAVDIGDEQEWLRGSPLGLGSPQGRALFVILITEHLGRKRHGPSWPFTYRKLEMKRGAGSYMLPFPTS